MPQTKETQIGESPQLASARAKYRQYMQDIRHLLFSTPHIHKSQRVREQAEFYLEQVKAVAFNLGIAPQQDYPRFHVDTLFGPCIYTIWGPNPDFIYAWVWVDGAKSYRIRGNRNDTVWGSFQVTSGFWGDPDAKNLSEVPFEDLDIDAEGSFEITVSAKPQKGNWLPLNADSENNYIFYRRTVVDWENERVAGAHIDLLDDIRRPIHMDEAKLARRIEWAGKTMKNATALYTVGLIQRALDHAGTNKFFCVNGDEFKDSGYNPGAKYFHAVYDLSETEALIIETEPADAKYWGVHLTDIWLQSIDFVHHQSSLNASQTKISSDGKIRIVLSLIDPGVENWLDPAGCGYGLIQFRSYYGTVVPPMATRVVALSELRCHLPADTATITERTRNEVLRRRARSILKHYGV